MLVLWFYQSIWFFYILYFKSNFRLHRHFFPKTWLYFVKKDFNDCKNTTAHLQQASQCKAARKIRLSANHSKLITLRIRHPSCRGRGPLSSEMWTMKPLETACLTFRWQPFKNESILMLWLSPVMEEKSMLIRWLMNFAMLIQSKMHLTFYFIFGFRWFWPKVRRSNMQWSLQM